MMTYKGSVITNTGTDSSTYSSATYNDSYSRVDGSYNSNTIKDSNGTIQYAAYPMYYTRTTSVILPYNWAVPKEGWIYTSTGWQQFYGRPRGIKNLCNVVFMKNSPFTLVAAIKYSTSRVTLSKVTPTGLSDLSTILNYRVLSAPVVNCTRIVIAGVTTAGKFAIWDCSNDNYYFNKIWEDTTTYSYSDTADITEGDISGTTMDVQYRYTSTNVLFHITNNSNIRSKCVQLVYDYEYDRYYRDVFTINTNSKLLYAKAKYSRILNKMMTVNSGSGTNYGHSHLYEFSNGTISYGNMDLPQSTCNSYIPLYNSGQFACSATLNNTGYIYNMTNYGANWTQTFWGDNVYRVIRPNPDNLQYFWAIGTSNTNYYRACGINNNGDYWSSVFTFPTSTAPSNRFQIPGYAFLLANSSTVYTYDMSLIESGTNQTVGTSSLTDENGNAFAAKAACWNRALDPIPCSRLYWFPNHTFYQSTNETNGTVLSELTYQSSSWVFQKETINVGGPVILSK